MRLVVMKEIQKGHYYCYSLNNNGNWYCYNDSNIDR